MIPPKPYKLKCPKCGYSKVIRLKSDALGAEDMVTMSPICSECGGEIERVKLNVIEDAISRLFGS